MPARKDISHLSREEQEKISTARAYARAAAAKFRQRYPDKVKSNNAETRRRRAADREATQDYQETLKRWRSNNRTRANEHSRHSKQRRRHEDPNARLAHALRCRIYHAIKGGVKSGSAVADLGCSLKELKLYLEEQFEWCMNWENHGSGPDDWHIDHVIPLAFYDLSDRQQFLSATHYTNLRPRWRRDNLAKGAKIEPPSLW